jgi:hypothetical protein
MSRDGVVLSNFTGGLNNASNPTMIEENELSIANNVVIGPSGKLTSRPAFFSLGTSASGTGRMRILGNFRNEDGVTFMVVATDTKTNLYNLSSGAFTEIWAYSAADMTTYLNRLYLVRTNGAGGYWSKVSGTYTFTTISAMPAANQILATMGRIYLSSRAIGNTSTIRYSNITSASAGTSIDQFPVENFIDVNEGDGQNLIKMLEGNGEIFLFRSNSTWRLAFGASAEPTDGSLTSLSSSIGVDNEFCVVPVDNTYAVLYAGTLYNFAGYNYYPLNNTQKVEFKGDGTWNVKTALSKVGPYLLVWFSGITYCYNTETKTWTTWTSNRVPYYLLEAPYGTIIAEGSPLTAYAVPAARTDGTALPFSPTFLRIKLEYGADQEQIVCTVRTASYDMGMPTKFKRLFGWEFAGTIVGYLKATLTPVEYKDTTVSTWSQLASQDWVDLLARTWNPEGAPDAVFINGLQTYNPVPLVVKISGKQTFKRATFEVSFENTGDQYTSPSTIDGLVLYMQPGRRMAIGHVA